MKKFFFLFVLALMCVCGFAQQVTLVFTGQDVKTKQHVKLSRIEINNLTKGWTEILTYPDTIAILTVGMGIDENVASGVFGLSQNTPNPFNGTTNVNLYVIESGSVSVEITDVTGRLVNKWSASLQPGVHQFRINLADAGIYFLTARQNGKTTSAKMVNNGNGTGNVVAYNGMGLRANFSSTKNGSKGNVNHPFDQGDEMTYKGYTIPYEEEVASEVLARTQTQSDTIVLSFEIPANPNDGKPCFGAATLTDIDSNTYNTVQIGKQCWMKENLKTTKYADGTSISQASGFSTTVGYWYYPNNNSSNVATYGLLYNWKAVMHNSSSSSTNPSNVQGICPTGWHVPSDAEWMQLTDYVGQYSEYTCSGSSENIAKTLSSTTGWNSSADTCTVGNTPGSNNATGFSAFPAGGYYDGGYSNVGFYASFWSATEEGNDYAYFRNLYYNRANVNSGYGAKTSGFSVRCLRGEAVDISNDGKTCSGIATLTDIDSNTYNTVQIGKQCWMKENLKTTKYADGTPILQGSDSSITVGYWYYPKNDISNVATYGLLYNWKAVMGNSSSSNTNPSNVQGVCPTGWHVPSLAELAQLTNYVSSQSQYNCRNNAKYIARALASTKGWRIYFTPCSVGYEQEDNNATGFGAFPAGDYASGYYGFATATSFWSATEYSSTYACGLFLSYNEAEVEHAGVEMDCGFSVRCLRD